MMNLKKWLIAGFISLCLVVPNFSTLDILTSADAYVIKKTSLEAYEPDWNASDQGAASATANRTIKDFVDAVGATKNAIIRLRHNSGGDTTIYTLTTTEVATDNFEFDIEPGAILDGAGTITIDGPFRDILSQCFGASILVRGLGKTDFIRPEWWGAKGDYNTTTKTGTNDSAAFKAAIDVIIANKLSKLKLSQSNYYFGSKVNIEPIAGHSAEMCIEAPGGSYSEDALSKESRIYGAAGIECLFDLGNGSALPFWGIEFNGVKFCGTTAGVDVKSAIKITSEYNGPFWPLIINRCYFEDFSTAGIWADSTLTYNLAFLSVKKSVFYHNGYGVFLDETGGVNRCYGLIWEDNRCHQNTTGIIRGAFGGGVSIRNNNMEGAGQLPINLTGTNVIFNVIIEGNYFEACDGAYIMQVTGTTSTNYIHISGNTYVNCTATTPIKAARCYGIVDDFEDTALGLCHKSITVRQQVHLDGWDFPAQAFSPNYALNQVPKENAAVTGERMYHSAVPSIVDTPFGPFPSRTLTSGGSRFKADAMTLSLNDYFIVSVLVRYKDGSAGSEGCYGKFAEATVTKEPIYGPMVGTYAWTVVMFAWKVDDAASAGDVDFYFYPYGLTGNGSGAIIAGAYCWKHTTDEVCPYIPQIPYATHNAQSGNYTLRSSMHGDVFTNTGASGITTLTLQPATIGLKYGAIRLATQAFRLDPSGAEIIQGGGAGKYLELDTDYDAVYLECFVVGKWAIIGGYGTLAYEP